MAYNPHSNLRAETVVKTMKRLISDNSNNTGTLDTDAMTATLLNYRKMPDRDTGQNPSQILFGRQLKDMIPCHPSKLILRKEWLLTSKDREKVLAKRHLSRHTDLLSK